ncbi:DUF222 domain-containing protein [Nocardia sp. NPDC005746]|uniref:DUF222 domain-containing protein n=1 Tax=Nocardia sp. NPDC005746 TaxID=3157062 RepID=UPI0033DE5001
MGIDAAADGRLRAQDDSRGGESRVAGEGRSEADFEVPGADAADRSCGRLQLAHFAATSTPDDLPKIGDRLLGYLDPDGRLTDDTDRQRRRGITLGKQGVDGMSTLTAELTPVARAVLDPIFASLSQPGMCNPQNYIECGYLACPTGLELTPGSDPSPPIPSHGLHGSPSTNNTQPHLFVFPGRRAAES